MEAWLTKTGHERGYVAPAQTFFEMSKDWYAGRMDQDWEPPTAEEAEAVFAKHGLTGDFWKTA